MSGRPRPAAHRGRSIILRPIRLSTSSTASVAVPFLTSRMGLTSTMSSEVDYAGLVDEFHEEVRFPVGEPSAHGRADAGGHFGVEHVEVEGEVDPVDVREVP